MSTVWLGLVSSVTVHREEERVQDHVRIKAIGGWNRWTYETTGEDEEMKREKTKRTSHGLHIASSI